MRYVGFAALAGSVMVMVWRLYEYDAFLAMAARV